MHQRGGSLGGAARARGALAAGSSTREAARTFDVRGGVEIVERGDANHGAAGAPGIAPAVLAARQLPGER